MDEATKREIERISWRTLRDAGQVEPPVQLSEILAHLELHRDFYDLRDPGFLDRAKHRMRVSGEKLVKILDKICLQAVLFQDEKRIVLDQSLPQIKQEWPSLHEVGHRILPWHQPYFYGDTAQTLDPEYQEHLESEANRTAGELMFCGRVFGREAKDTVAQWSSVERLKERYGKSLSTTLRRYVEHGPDVAMAMVVSTPWWMEIPEDQESRRRHFVPSPRFAIMFGSGVEEVLLGAIERQSSQRRGGPVADFTMGLRNASGDLCEVRGETFFNRYYLLSLFVVTEDKVVRPRFTLSSLAVGGRRLIGGRR